MTDHWNTPKPIETHYAGCRFRSRLEARWAVFFDHLGIRWHYEPQGFTLSTGDNYLPDFYLPDLDQWVEVKGKADGGDVARIVLAADELPANPRSDLLRPGVLVLGSIPAPVPHSALVHMRVSAVRGLAMFLPSVFMRSKKSMIVFTVGGPHVEDLRGSLERDALRGAEPSNINDTRYHPLLRCDPDALAAYIAARSARFEHGEQG